MGNAAVASTEPVSVARTQVMPTVSPWNLAGMATAFVLLNRAIQRVIPGISVGVPNADGSVESVDESHARMAFVVFTAALFFNVNAAAFSIHDSKRKLNLQVAYISTIAAYTHYEMAEGRDWYVNTFGPSGEVVSFSGLRQLEWACTTPILLLLVQNLHAFVFAALPRAMGPKKTSLTTTRDGTTKAANAIAPYVPVNRIALILADELMILCGLVAPLTRGLERFAFLSVAMACFGFIIYHSLFALVDITRRADGLSVADAGRVKCIAALKMIAWTVYPAVYFAVLFGVMTPARQHEIYLYNDVLTKFSYSLVISAGSMRFVEMVDQKRTQLTAHMAGMQRTFFFNITHELRTPLNSIIGFNTLAMESGELTEFTESFIKASLTSAEALLSLINQILDVAKFEGAKDAGSSDGPAIELSEDVFTLRQLIEQVTDISQKASSSGVDLVIHIEHPEHFNTKFVGDFFRLRQCCVNLVDNAIKYSSNVQGRSSLVEFTMSICRARGQRAGSARGERGGGDSRGQRDQQSEKGDESIFDDVRDVSGITFSVKDNGVGIPAAKQHNLFVPFSQPADHKAAKEKGTGLGLVITKNIIECMGGEIEFESKEDEGTKFFFTVDFKHARLSAVDYEEEFEGATDLGFGSAVSGGGLDTEHEQSLPANARVVLHPGMSASSRKHVVNILKCFGGRAGVNYVSVPSADKLAGKIEQASGLGIPIVLADIEDTEKTLNLVKQTPKKAGVVIFGLPYQLIDFHRRTSDLRNVQTVLRPVKPSDFLRAAWKLANVNALGEPDWMHDTGGECDDGVAERLRAAEANADHNAGRAAADSGASASPGDEGDGATAAAASSASAEDLKHELLAGMRVLLVEDNVMNQQMAKFSIIRSGAELEIAQHGKEAVDMVSSRLEQKLPNYDCVLMDMMMPVMDGATATVLIRELEKKHGAEKPHAIVGLSANVGPEYTDKVKKAGMNGSLSKPFYPATLRNVLEQVYKGTYAGFSGKGGKDAAAADIQSKPGN